MNDAVIHHQMSEIVFTVMLFNCCRNAHVCTCKCSTVSLSSFATWPCYLSLFTI